MADLERTDPDAGGPGETEVPKSRRKGSKAAPPAASPNENDSAGGSDSEVVSPNLAQAARPAGPSSRPENVSITQGGADRVDADSVHVTQGGITTVTAQAVSLRQGGIATASAEDVTVSMGGIGIARADRVSVEMGGLGLAIAGDVRVTQGYARSIIARETTVEQALVGTLITGRATIQRPTGVLLLVAGRVEGPVKAMFDWRGAIAFGAAFGVILGLLRRR
jgi:hypothetical protein